MSFVTLQIGQCGNQIGEAYYERIFKELMNSPPAQQACAFDKFFFEKENKGKDNDIIAKSLLIDMEPKVVEKCLSSSHLWKYSPSNSYCKQEGSGNNWAFGYNIHGPESKEPISDKICKLLEKIDFCDNFLILQSLAGGTGSGLGTFVLDVLKDEFPEITRVNLGILPHMSGDVILQCYNTLLSISKILESSDGIILYENDEIDFICKKLLNAKNPTLNQMNGFIAQNLASVFYPIIEKEKISSPFDNRFNMCSDYLDSVITSPANKLLKIYNVPMMPDTSVSFSCESWNGLEKRLYQMSIGNTTEANIHWNLRPDSQFANKSFSNLLIARGMDAEKHNFDFFKEKKGYIMNNRNFTFAHDSHNFNETEKSLSVLSNSQAFNSPLEFLLTGGIQMFEQKAYLFQYEKFGLTKDDFIESFALIEQLLSNYK